MDFRLPTNRKLAETPAFSGIDPKHVYDLAELIDVAQSNNQNTRIAWNSAREAALAAGVVRSTYLPRIMVSAVGGYSYSHSRSTTQVGVGGVDLPPADGGASTRLSGGVSSISLTWLLFDFGQRAAVTDAATQASVIANIAFTGAHQQLIHDVSLAFYANSADRTKITANRRSLDDARQVEAATRAKAEHQQATAVEIAEGPEHDSGSPHGPCRRCRSGAPRGSRRDGGPARSPRPCSTAAPT